MGKHYKRSLYLNCFSSPEEEKRKIRKSILAEFRQHFQAEENALGIPKPDGKKSDGRQTLLIHRHTSDDKDSSMGSQEDIVKRKRRRKTKAERNKTRSKSASSQSDMEIKADIGKHIRTAHTVTYPLRSKGHGQRDESFSAITQHRLTKRLGLFNKGKKSGTVTREPIVLSESLRRRTDDDLKKILDIADDKSDVAMETDHDPIGGISGPGPSLHSLAVLYNPMPKTKITPVSLVKPNNPHTVSSTSTGISTCPSSIELEEFPETPPMENIVQQLVDKLEDHKIFRGRDIERELCDDLNKEMKRNAPRDSTPASVKTVSVASTSCGSNVCRSLLDSFTPQNKASHQSTKNLTVERTDSIVRTHTVQDRHVTSQHYEQKMQKAAPNVSQLYHGGCSLGSLQTRLPVHKANSIKDLALMAQIENIASRVKQSFKTSGDPVSVRMNAMDLLKHNDEMCLKHEISCTVSNPGSTIAQQMTDALDLLTQNDKLLESRMHQEMDISTLSNKENLQSMQTDLQSNRSYSSQDHLTNSQSSGFHSHHSSDLTMRRPILNQLLCGSNLSPRTGSRNGQHTAADHDSSPETHKAVLAEYCEDTQYMPRFHGDFYKDSLWFDKTILSSIEQMPDLQTQHPAEAKDTDTSSMDILDYLDQSSQASVDILPHSSHPSNRSPNWPSCTNPYLLPPRPVSPDSPQMFPRRLY